MYYLNELIKEKDIAVILETGINKNGKIKDVTEYHNVIKINYIKDIEREQYQHNGNGTAIFTHRNLDYQTTRNIFNGPKSIA